MILCLNCMQTTESRVSNFCEHCGNPFTEISSPQHHLRAGTYLCNGKYIVGKAIGEGGFGITYIGRDTNLELRVAIKEYYLSGYVARDMTNNTISSISASGKDDTEAIFRRGRDSFHDEARLLARLSGQAGIVNVRDFFRENNTVYIVMEYLAGNTLKQILKSGKRFTEGEIKELLYPVINSLTKIHRESLLHRDISPDNIMIVDGQAKLIDFGAARGYASAANRSSSIIVKPGYAPIEQYGTKREQGPWTDIYALCATIYRCITGKVPDIATDRVVSDELKTPSELGIAVSPEFERILMKGMSVLKKNRYQYVEELMQDLYGIVPQKPQSALPIQPFTPNSTPTANHISQPVVTNSKPLHVTAQQPDRTRNNSVSQQSQRIDTQNNKVISNINAAIAVPVVGELFPRAVLHTVGAKITSMRWMEGDAPTRDATFSEGRFYGLIITISPEDGHEFAEDITASIGGIAAEIRTNPNGTITLVRNGIIPIISGAPVTAANVTAVQKNSGKRLTPLILVTAVVAVCMIAAIFYFNALTAARNDLSNPIICVDGDYYEMPLKVSDMLDKGWELADSERNGYIDAKSSRYVGFKTAADLTVSRMVTNNTNKEIECEDGLIYTHNIIKSDEIPMTVAGIGIGTKESELKERLSGVEYTGNSTSVFDTYKVLSKNDGYVEIFVKDGVVDRIEIKKYQ